MRMKGTREKKVRNAEARAGLAYEGEESKKFRLVRLGSEVLEVG